MFYILFHVTPSDGAQNFLRLFDYISFRAGGAFVTSMLIVWFCAPRFIRFLRRMNTAGGERYDAAYFDASMTNAKKAKVPSMGGLLLVGAILISVLLWARLDNTLIVGFLITLCLLCGVGFYDDLCKIRDKHRRAYEKARAAAENRPPQRFSESGMSAFQKFAAQSIIATSVILFLWLTPTSGFLIDKIMLPFLKNPVGFSVPMIDSLAPAGLFASGLCCAMVAFLISAGTVVASSNAVNLTDGRDGLATGCLIIAIGTFMIFAYFSGHRVFANYLLVPYIPSAGEICVFCAAMIGACCGFLWYNCAPAQVYMGDTGSLPLGGCLGLIAVLVRQEFLLLLVGGVFVMEAGSVVIQVASNKLFGKRPFLCTPIHHHFESKRRKKRLRWSETQITVRFWILAALFALLGLLSLKLR